MASRSRPTRRWSSSLRCANGRGSTPHTALHTLTTFPLSHLLFASFSLVQVLAHPSNVGYEHLTNHIVLRVNGSPLTSLKQLVELLDHPSPDMSHLIFELEPHDERVVLDATSVKEVTAELLHLHQIPSDRSVDLRVGGESSAAAAASSKGKAKRGRS